MTPPDVRAAALAASEALDGLRCFDPLLLALSASSGTIAPEALDPVHAAFAARMAEASAAMDRLRMLVVPPVATVRAPAA